MAKHRTRKQKERARHNFIIYQPSTSKKGNGLKKIKSEISVKGQFNTTLQGHGLGNSQRKMTRIKAKTKNLASVKSSIVRSLIQACIVLGLELMLYFLWK